MGFIGSQTFKPFDLFPYKSYLIQLLINQPYHAKAADRKVFPTIPPSVALYAVHYTIWDLCMSVKPWQAAPQTENLFFPPINIVS